LLIHDFGYNLIGFSATYLKGFEYGGVVDSRCGLITNGYIATAIGFALASCQ
jgi:hypothetical protein